jgi:signal transduction histidine kinase/ActR/RegA family two-component response regulator
VGLGGSRTTEILKGGTLAVNDTSSEPHSIEERAALRAAGIGAYICPLLVKDGRFVGSFGIHSRTPRMWTADEIALAEEVADRIWTTFEHRKAEAELRANEERLAFLLRLNDALRPLSDPNAVLEAAARLVGEHLGVTRVGYVEVDGPTYVIRHEYTRGVAPLTSQGLSGGFGAALREAYLRGDTVVVNDVASDDRFTASERVTMQERQIAAFIGVTLIKGGRLTTAFGANNVTPRCWTATEVTLIRDVAERTWEAVERARAEAALRAQRDEEQITERERAALALQERTAELEFRTTQLSRMAWDLTLAEHHAREQIARTLHDGLQQLLLIAGLNLEQQLKREREAGGTPGELLTEAKYHLDEAVVAARSLHLELFPPVLQRSGLPAALTWLANWAHDKYKLNVLVDADPHADTPRKDVRTLLFESARELLFNAFKHARADRVTLALRLHSDDQLSVTVTDNGIGFEPARLDDRSKVGQVGWGLFSIRERLTLLGGRVDLESAPARGTRVLLIAPRGAARIAPGGNGSDFVTAVAAPGGNLDQASPDALRVLIVDDHAALRKTLREMLNERPQLTVVGDASNGFEAIAHAHTLRPDVILMDVAMPHMDGVEAAARIRAELPGIQILGMSMQAPSEAVHAIERAGAVGFFVKGIDTQRMIDYLVAAHAVRDATQRANS